MKLSHEVPIQILQLSETFNDYDYCLPHLLDQYPDMRYILEKQNKKGDIL